jgi:hypothetical protein
MLPSGHLRVSLGFNSPIMVVSLEANTLVAQGILGAVLGMSPHFAASKVKHCNVPVVLDSGLW